VTGAGDLNRRVVLEAPSETEDGAGGVTRAYVAIATVWAQIVPHAMRAEVSAQSLGAAQFVRIVLRRRDGITTAHRLREGERIYRIVAARESADRRFTEIDAGLRQD
jgi:SPP1 family predicted phage head-tail adaptor